MKYKIVLLIILFPVFASAQTNTRDSLASAKLKDLIDSWSLGIKDNGDVDVQIYNKFKSLFDSSAKIENDLDVVYHYNRYNKKGSYQNSKNYKAFDIYAHDVALQIKNLSKDSIVRINSGSTGENDKWFLVTRYVEFQKAGKYVLPPAYVDSVLKDRQITYDPKSDSIKKDSLLKADVKKNEDSIYKFRSTNTLVIRMTFFTPGNVKIISIKDTNYKAYKDEITCLNDADSDAVLNGTDADPTNPGDFTANGRPDYDLDGVPDSRDKCSDTYGTEANKGCPIRYFYTDKGFDVFVGLQFNSAKINLPELNQLGYEDKSGNDLMDVLQSQKGVLKNNGQLVGVHAGANFIYYFGKRKKKSGISVGFDYSRFTAEYELTQPIVYTFKSFDGVDFYRRQITISSLNERINYNVFNLPVMFNYRFHLGKKDKSVIKLQVGPSLMFFQNTSNYNAVIDFGGLYQIDTIQKNNITYYDHFQKGSAYNVLLTSNDINAQNLNPGANEIFQQLNSGGYDFASNKNYNGTQNLQRTTIAFNAGMDLQQKLSEGLTIKAGVNFVYAPLLERKEKYKPVDKTSDEFQSIYYSTAKSAYSAFGINIGIVYNW